MTGGYAHNDDGTHRLPYEPRNEGLERMTRRARDAMGLIREAQSVMVGRVTCEAAERKLEQAHQVLVLLEEDMVISLLVPEEPA